MAQVQRWPEPLLFSAPKIPAGERKQSASSPDPKEKCHGEDEEEQESCFTKAHGIEEDGAAFPETGQARQQDPRSEGVNGDLAADRDCCGRSARSLLMKDSGFVQ